MGRQVIAARPAERQAAERATVALLASIALTVALYLVPYGHWIGWPLVLVSTVAHELGHGIAGVLVGGTFDKLYVWSDASGMAYVYVHDGRLARAFVAAGGLVGPACAAALGFAFGRSARAARIALLVAAGVLFLALLLVVRNFFGVAFVALLASALAWIGVRLRAERAQLVVVFLSIQLALSVFSRGDYLFTDTARMATGPMPSDVANMAAALPLPYWFWGAVCGAFSLAVLALGTWLFARTLLRAAPPGQRLNRGQPRRTS